MEGPKDRQKDGPYFIGPFWLPLGVQQKQKRKTKICESYVKYEQVCCLTIDGTEIYKEVL